MRKRIPAAVALAAAIGANVVLLWPRQPAADASSCSLTGSSYAGSVVNPPVGEDTDFFVNTGGVPNVMFLLANSASMTRLPPDGASRSWGSFEPSGSTTAGAGYGCTNAFANGRRFHSACGATTWEDELFSGAHNYAEAKDSTGAYCPYAKAGNNSVAIQTDKAGFDPDFYPTFFGPTAVYKDAVVTPSEASGGDGWTSTGTASPSTVDAFCTGQSTPEKRVSCTSCMTQRGYWFDGTYRAVASGSTWQGLSCKTSAECAARGYGTCIKNGLEYNSTVTDANAKCQLPNVWFSGNFLNMYPPKFIVARKVLKDVLQSVRKVRLAVTTFNGANGGALQIDPNPSCNLVGSPSSFDSNRSAMVNKFDSSGTTIPFSGDAPLAETLLDIGHLYVPNGATWFNGQYSHSDFIEKTGTNQSTVCFACQQSSVIVISDGIATADGKIPGNGDTMTSPMTAALSSAAGVWAGDSRYNIAGISQTDCPLCDTTDQTVDGVQVNPLAPDTTVTNGTCAGQQLSGACDDNKNPIASYLPKVAWYFHNVDLRPNTASDFDGNPMAGKQTMNVYTIGLGATGNGSKILDRTAQAGGGLYNGGSGREVTDVSALRNAILRSLDDVNTRSTSFGAASVSTLQSSASQGVLVPRFEPSRTAHWNGHLFAFDLYSEFTSGKCTVPASGPTSPGTNFDYDCDRKCTSVFLKDKDGDFIQEDATGAFVKNANPALAPCPSGTTPSTSTCACSGPSTTPAKPYWDAGAKLASTNADGITPKAEGTFTAWSARKIYTVIDSNHDGQITRDDEPLIQLNDSTTQADDLTPYLNIKGSRFCSDLADRLTAVGNPIASTIRTELGQTPKQYTSCARVLLQYVRGADVFNETNNACGTWPGTLCTRAYQLGDVFHSSPVTVYPPLPPPPVGIVCDAGLHPQCLPTLWESPVKNEIATGKSFSSAYHEYQDAYKARGRFALVGANDGLLHAFQNGSSATDVGTGQELWAFLPPDLLAKLPDFTGNQHHYFVDGTPMVRDTWIDGLENGKSSLTAAAGDHKKQAREFHTVAVVGERRGGNHYFALDVTDADTAAPKFLWIYPQPNDKEELAFGETWSDFQPAPPPIGPVRIEHECGGNYLESGTTCFEERWIAFLSGGFDPNYTRGRGVHMVDLETGKELFDFSQPPGAANTCDPDSSDPRCHLNYPVAAPVGMMGWGDSEYGNSSVRPAYFDTATFGDTGGQVWVVRFATPGTKVNGKVNNWFGARLFQSGAASGTALPCGLDYCGGEPIFQITANVRLAANGAFRVMFGTGDRFNLLDVAGGTCGPDNLRACLLKGCSVKLEGASGTEGAQYGVNLLGLAGYRSDQPALCSGTPAASYTQTFSAGSGTACSGVTHKVDSLVISCPSSVTCSGQAETTTKKMRVDCTIDANSEYCVPSSTNAPGMTIDVKGTNLTGTRDMKNWFFSVRAFDTSGSRMIFKTVTDAVTYDKARYDETSTALVSLNAYDADTAHPVSKLATPDGAGWKLYFNNGGAVTATATQVSINGQSYDIYRTDERVASNPAVEQGCGFWNTMQPVISAEAWDAATDCPKAMKCKAGKTQLAYTYSAKPGTGEPCMLQDVNSTAVVRSVQTQSLVPPQIGKLVAYVASGQVSFGLTSVRVPGGGTNISLGETQDFQSITQWLPVDRNLHDCRHTSRSGPAPANCKW